ncbi:MAG: hypothetical protein H6668_22135 [Ardenticatenaceae bacterium]|nr:hypothetical protein [Ardenticatenaceae bacterium]
MLKPSSQPQPHLTVTFCPPNDTAWTVHSSGNRSPPPAGQRAIFLQQLYAMFTQHQAVSGHARQRRYAKPYDLMMIF